MDLIKTFDDLTIGRSPTGLPVVTLTNVPPAVEAAEAPARRRGAGRPSGEVDALVAAQHSAASSERGGSMTQPVTPTKNVEKDHAAKSVAAGRRQPNTSFAAPAKRGVQDAPEAAAAGMKDGLKPIPRKLANEIRTIVGNLTEYAASAGSSSDGNDKRDGAHGNDGRDGAIAMDTLLDSYRLRNSHLLTPDLAGCDSMIDLLRAVERISVEVREQGKVMVRLEPPEPLQTATEMPSSASLQPVQTSADNSVHPASMQPPAKKQALATRTTMVPAESATRLTTNEESATIVGQLVELLKERPGGMQVTACLEQHSRVHKHTIPFRRMGYPGGIHDFVKGTRGLRIDEVRGVKMLMVDLAARHKRAPAAAIVHRQDVEASAAARTAAASGSKTGSGGGGGGGGGGGVGVSSSGVRDKIAAAPVLRAPAGVAATAARDREEAHSAAIARTSSEVLELVNTNGGRLLVKDLPVRTPPHPHPLPAPFLSIAT